MLIIHQLLVELAKTDGPRTLGDMYSAAGRLIKPEQAARRFGPNNKLPIEDRLHRGRVAIIVRGMSSLVRRGWVEVAEKPKTRKGDLSRSWRVTDRGRAKVAALSHQGSRHDGKLVRRVSDPDVLDHYRQVLANVRLLLSAEWADEDELRGAAVADVTDHAAMRTYLYYSRGGGTRWSDDKKRTLGRRHLFRQALHHCAIEVKDEGGRRYVRLRRPDGEYPRLAKIG